MNESLMIKYIAQKDLDFVIEIQRCSYTPNYHERKNVFQNRINLFRHGCKMAFLDDYPIAYLFSHPWRMDFPLVALDTLITRLPDDPDCLYIHDISVHPNFRGRGIGKQMVTEAKNISRKLNLKYMILVAVQDSEKFWEQSGFVPATLPLSVVATELRSYGSSRLMIGMADGTIKTTEMHITN